MKRDELIESLIADTKSIIETVQNEFVLLNDDELTKKPTQDKWSVLECIDHLNIADAHYLDQFRKKVNGVSHSNPNSDFNSGLLGNYFVKMIKPREGGLIPSPMKTLKKFIPKAQERGDTINKFLEDQKEILNTLAQCRHLDLGRIKITSAIGPIVTFKLGDSLRFLIGHNQRHILQAQRVLEGFKSTVQKKAVQF